MFIPCEITHSKNESLPIVFILSTQNVHPMRVHNPEYQLPVTSGSRVTGCAKLPINVRRNNMRKVCLTTFIIVTVNSETLKQKNQKKD